MSQDGKRGRHRARCSGAENVKAVTRIGLSRWGSRPGPGPRELRQPGAYPDGSGCLGSGARHTNIITRRLPSHRPILQQGDINHTGPHSPSSRCQVRLPY